MKAWMTKSVLRKRIMADSTHKAKGFTPLELEHKDELTPFFLADPPQASELTFTNLFMWRHHHRPAWHIHQGCLCISLCYPDSEPFGLRPIGSGDKAAALDFLMGRLGAVAETPSVQRAEAAFVEGFVDRGRYRAEPDRDQFDYVYPSEKLAALSGRKLHKKKNHLNRFLNSVENHQYRPLEQGLVDAVLGMQEDWCRMRECSLHPELLDEDHAVFEALQQFGRLDYIGGVVLIEDKVQAFSLGEMLNKDTAVIHIEKANPEIPGLYAAVNQMFAQNAWGKAEFINREQDLGVEGLRKAKLSYQPHHLVEKYTLTPIN